MLPTDFSVAPDEKRRGEPDEWAERILDVVAVKSNEDRIVHRELSDERLEPGHRVIDRDAKDDKPSRGIRMTLPL